MKVCLLFSLIALVPEAALGQGQFIFNNDHLPDVDAPFYMPSTASPAGVPVNPDWHVALWVTREGFPLTLLWPLDPSSVGLRADFAGYVVPTTVTAPGIESGVPAVVYLDLRNEAGELQGSLGYFDVTLGGGDLPIPYLNLGTAPIVATVPEPDCATLLLCGTALLWSLWLRQDK